MAARKKADAAGPLLPAKTTAPAAPVVTREPPSILEYTPELSHEKWQAMRFAQMAAEFGFMPSPDWISTMRVFHAFAEPDTQRWFFVRRLFGVMPLIPRQDAQLDDMRVHERDELATSMGILPRQLGEELAHLRSAWGEHQKQLERREQSLPVARSGRMADQDLELDDVLLGRFGFDKSLFVDVEDYVYDDATKEKVYRRRSAEKSNAEMQWFIGRLRRREWQKMLDDPMAGALARTTLINELYLHRFDAEMFGLMPTTPRWQEMSKSRRQIEEQYQKQMDKLREEFPELGVVDRVSNQIKISDLSLAHRQYYGHGDNRLWDGCFTALEIEFMHRTSLQLPKPRYLLSWSLMVVEARHGLMDPNFRSMLKKPTLRRLDRGYLRGVEEARLEEGDKPLSLEAGVLPGEPGTDEFPDYLAPGVATPNSKLIEKEADP